MLGSDPFRADIVVRDIEVELEHAEIYPASDGGYLLKDLGTGEPTIVNEEAIEDREVTLLRRPHQARRQRDWSL